MSTIATPAAFVVTYDPATGRLNRADAADIADDLVASGPPAECELDDGRLVRFDLEPDDLAFDDIAEWGDYYGRTGWSPRRDGRCSRPDDFDGGAEILHRDSHGDVWWQPPADGPRRGAPEFRHLRTLVADICEYGFSVVRVELYGTADDLDAYGRRIVRGVAAIGGVEPFVDPDYLRELVAELVAEVVTREEVKS